MLNSVEASIIHMLQVSEKFSRRNKIITHIFQIYIALPPCLSDSASALRCFTFLYLAPCKFQLRLPKGNSRGHRQTWICSCSNRNLKRSQFRTASIMLIPSLLRDQMMKKCHDFVTECKDSTEYWTIRHLGMILYA